MNFVDGNFFSSRDDFVLSMVVLSRGAGFDQVVISGGLLSGFGVSFHLGSSVSIPHLTVRSLSSQGEGAGGLPLARN